jgi:hypothetical protein
MNETFFAIGLRAMVECRRGELLSILEARTYSAEDIPHTQRRKAGRVRLHRDFLQPDTQAH